MSNYGRGPVLPPGLQPARIADPLQKGVYKYDDQYGDPVFYIP